MACSVGNGTENMDELASEFMAYRIGLLIHIIYPPIIGVIGLCGNLVSILVMVQRKNRKVPCCILLAGLAVSDNIILAASIGGWATTVPLSTLTSDQCQVITFFFKMGGIGSALLTVAVTADRFIMTCCALRIFSWHTPSRAFILCLILTVLSAIPALLVATRATLINGMTCASFAQGPSHSETIVLMVVFGLLPITVILGLNAAVIRVLRRGERLRRLHCRDSDSQILPIHIDNPISRPFGDSRTGSIIYSDSSHRTSVSNISTLEIPDACDETHPAFVSDPSEIDSSCWKNCGTASEVPVTPRDKRGWSVERQLTCVLLKVSVVFIILRLPQFVRFVVYSFIYYRDDPATYATYILIYNISNKLYITNSAIGLLMYALPSSKFQSDIKVLMKNTLACCLLKRSDYVKDNITVSSNCTVTRF